MVRFAPDIVQTCHLPCAHFLRSVVPDVIRVHAMLGVIPSLEAPPLEGAAFSLGLAVSEEVLDRINKTSFGRDVDTAIFRNWFDDKVVMTSTRALKSRGRLRVAVIYQSHCAGIDRCLGGTRSRRRCRGRLLWSAAKICCRRWEICWLNTIWSSRSDGRVLLAAACGVPCIMADIHGSDGLLTVDNLDHVRTVNFSGRLQKHPITKTHLQVEIEKIRSYDREQLRNRIAAEYSLASRTTWLLARYEELLVEKTKWCTEASPQPFDF